jgi:hypothetical protein
MMMSTLSLGTAASSSPRLSATALATPASNKKDSSSTAAQLGVTPLGPQALTNDVFAPSVSLKMPADAPATSSAATVETPEAKDKKTAPKKETVETKPTTETKPVGKVDNEASPEKIEQAKTIMAETGTKFSAEKDPAKAKKLLNDTYAQLKALNLPKENLIVHAMQLDVWDAAIVNLLPANEKPASAVSVTAPATTSAEKQTPAKDASKETTPSVNLLA